MGNLLINKLRGHIRHGRVMGRTVQLHSGLPVAGSLAAWENRIQISGVEYWLSFYILSNGIININIVHEFTANQL